MIGLEISQSVSYTHANVQNLKTANLAIKADWDTRKYKFVTGKCITLHKSTTDFYKRVNGNCILKTVSEICLNCSSDDYEVKDFLSQYQKKIDSLSFSITKNISGLWYVLKNYNSDKIDNERRWLGRSPRPSSFCSDYDRSEYYDDYSEDEYKSQEEIDFPSFKTEQDCIIAILGSLSEHYCLRILKIETKETINDDDIVQSGLNLLKDRIGLSIYINTDQPHLSINRPYEVYCYQNSLKRIESQILRKEE